MNLHLAQPTMRWFGLSVVLALAGCGGGDSSSSTAATSAQRMQATSVQPEVAVSAQADVVRLAHQATFGPSESLLNEMRQLSAAAWISQQMTLSNSVYSSGGGGGVHKNVGGTAFCSSGAQASNPNCWRDNYSTEPLAWDFYRNATSQPDQLRQRVALALDQLLIVSGVEVSGTYGLRNYHSIFLSNAFGNYRDVLRKVTLSPVMGDYLNHVNNDKKAPNENYAREMLQLFSLGTCLLKPNGDLLGGRCQPTYNNDVVRNYAYALTGWTYPAGGSSVWGCWPTGANCRYYGGDMVPVERYHDQQSRALLTGIRVPVSSTTTQALTRVLDSIMTHGNVAPFVSRHLIQQLVRSNPSSAYVGRVATAFRSGRYSFQDGDVLRQYGTGATGDLAATVAAVLLDTEASNPAATDSSAGKLRSPILHITGAIRALNGYTDGAPFVWWWGDEMMMNIFHAPSVFSYYPPNFPVPGPDNLVGPEFGIHNVRTALSRLNLVTYLLDWNGSAADASIPNATGTRIDTTKFQTDAGQVDVLVDRLSRLLLGRVISNVDLRAKIIRATNYWTKDNAPTNWKDKRVRAAAWLLLNAPDYLVQQ